MTSNLFTCSYVFSLLLPNFFSYKFLFYIKCCSYQKHAVSVRMGTTIPLEHCRLAETIKNDPGQWKFIGIEGKLNNC